MSLIAGRLDEESRAAGSPAGLGRRIGAFLGVDGRTLLPTVGSGLVVGLAILVPVVSYPSLVFSGPLQAFSGIGVGLGLLSALVLTMALVVGGSVGGTVGVAHSEPAIVLAVIAASVVNDLRAVAAEDHVLPTVMATVVIAAAAVGAVFLLLGTLRLGNLIRFVPYPLIVGFIGGMGWLLIGGAVQVSTGLPLAIESLPWLVEPASIIRWLPAFCAGAFLWFLQRSRPRALNVPVTAFGIVAAFWAVMLASGTPMAALAADGWMLAPVPPFGSWLSTPPQAVFFEIDWAIVLDHWPQILTLVAVSLMGVLMQASVIEIAARSDVDLNRELRALGVGNLVCAMLGSLPGYHSLGVSLLSFRSGRLARAIGLTVGVMMAAILCFGGAAVAYVPKLVLGALLFYVGLDVFMGALLNVHLRRAWAEFAVAMLVFATVAFVGLLQGLAIGVTAGIVLFVVKYSQVDVVRRQTSAVEHHSKVVRSARSRSVLNELGDRVLVLELQGYIFFGTSNLLVNRIRGRISGEGAAPPLFVLLDFRRVTGIDSSVSLSLGKLIQYGRTHGFTLLATGLPLALRPPFERLAAGEQGSIRIFSDLDHGLEYCEDQVLASATGTAAPPEATLEQQLRQAGGSNGDIAALMRYVDRHTYAKGEPLICQGEASRDLFYIERGSVTIRLILHDGRQVRLRTMGAGTVVGEIAVYLQRPRCASVVADGETVAVRLTGEALASMHERDPGAAALLHAFMARQLAEKLVASTQEVAASHA
jgi:sulfate permease, SulP family